MCILKPVMLCAIPLKMFHMPPHLNLSRFRIAHTPNRTHHVPALCVSQIDLETIKDMYLEKYDVPLKEAISSECGGDFKRLLVAICH